METPYLFVDDVKLLELIRDNNDIQAFNEFVKRYHPTITEHCITKCKLRKLDKHIGIQIAHDTFDKIKKSKSFKKEKLNGADSKSAIFGWLFRISSNLFYDYHNSQKKDNNINESYFDELFDKAKEISVDSLEEKRNISLEIISKLNLKEREVIITDLEYKRSQKYLPDEVTESLANRIGVKKSSIRKIRERALLKLKKAIDEINK